MAVVSADLKRIVQQMLNKPAVLGIHQIVGLRAKLAELEKRIEDLEP